MQFSIIIPAYNRARELPSAIESCIAQGRTGLEILVVDDGSADETYKVAQELATKYSAVRVFRHEANLGVGPARNTAIREAIGDWCVMLDSDMELQPGGLDLLEHYISMCDPDVGNVASAQLWDTGETTPIPMPPTMLVLNPEAYLYWTSKLKQGEYFNCVRRKVFSQGIWYPENRGHEEIFHLQLISRWRFAFAPALTALYKTTSENRLCAPKQPAERRMRLLADARGHLECSQKIIDEHGELLKAHDLGRYCRGVRWYTRYSLLLFGVVPTWRALRARKLIPYLGARGVALILARSCGMAVFVWLATKR